MVSLIECLGFENRSAGGLIRSSYILAAIIFGTPDGQGRKDATGCVERSRAS